MYEQSSTKKEGGLLSVPEKSNSDCTSMDGGSRDDSTDEGGDSDGFAQVVAPNNRYIHDRDEIHGENLDINDVNSGGNYDESTRFEGKNKKKRQLANSVTEDQKCVRRDRNREHAKKSRLRKKLMLNTLQSSLEALQHENNRLKAAITAKVEGNYLCDIFCIMISLLLCL